VPYERETIRRVSTTRHPRAVGKWLRTATARLIQPIVWCNSQAMPDLTSALEIPTYVSQFEYYFQPESPSFNPRRFLDSWEKG
jgi:hypothetical protein